MAIEPQPRKKYIYLARYFRSLGQDKTDVTITNSGIQGMGDDLIRQVADSTGGFTLVLAGLKAWLEHGIELNLVGDKFPAELMGGN